jgi:hypothetical protein
MQALAGVPSQRALGARAGSRRKTVKVVAAVKDVFMPALSSTMTEGKRGRERWRVGCSIRLRAATLQRFLRCDCLGCCAARCGERKNAPN